MNDYIPEENLNCSKCGKWDTFCECEELKVEEVLKVPNLSPRLQGIWARNEKRILLMCNNG